MARAFDGLSAYLSYGSPVLTAVPISMSTWAKPAAVSGNQAMMGIYGSVSGPPANDSFELLLSATDFLVRTRAGGSGGANATISGVASAGVWQQFGGVYTAANARAAYYNGGSKATDTVSRTPSGLATTTLAVDQSGPSNYYGGSLAETAIWNAALTDEEMLALGKGVCPLLIRPQSLVAYWPLYGNDSPEPDRWATRYDLSLTGTVTKSEHPPIFYPSGIISGSALLLGLGAAVGSRIPFSRRQLLMPWKNLNLKEQK